MRLLEQGLRNRGVDVISADGAMSKKAHKTTAGFRATEGEPNLLDDPALGLCSHS